MIKTTNDKRIERIVRKLNYMKYNTEFIETVESCIDDEILKILKELNNGNEVKETVYRML